MEFTYNQKIRSYVSISIDHIVCYALSLGPAGPGGVAMDQLLEVGGWLDMMWRGYLQRHSDAQVSERPS